MKQLLYGLGGLVAIVAGSIGGYLGWSGPVEEDPYVPGDTVANFTLQNIYNETVSLSDFADRKGMVILFTSNTCPYALLYEERIIRLADSCHHVGMGFLVLNPNDPEIKPGDGVAELVKRAEDAGYNFPYLIDDRGIFSRFGATKTPEVFLLDRNRVLQYRGAIDDNIHNADKVKENYLERAIDAVLTGELPAVRETRVVGCTIKAKSGIPVSN